MIRLHGYWRSTASYRVRIALNLKGLAWENIPHDLRRGEQRAADFTAHNPQGLVPVLETDHGWFSQSGAIVEWLDESYPAPPLLPSDAQGRALVRAMAGVIACDIHPLHNLRVLHHLRQTFAADEAAVTGWIRHWIAEGFAALEQLISRHGGDFAYGDQPGLADCHLVPQLYGAERFGLDLTPYPRLVAVARRAAALPAFAAAHPAHQPDADR